MTGFQRAQQALIHPLISELQPRYVTFGDPADYIVNPGDIVDGIGIDGVGRVIIEIGTNFITCSGSLLSTGRHVLTAAHCLTDDDGNLIADSTAVTFNLPSGNATIDASAVFVHPDWDGNFLRGHDIAVIELASEAPAEAQRYDIFTIRDGTEIGKVNTKVGYGQSGTGNTGATLPDGTKRAGNNIYDALADIFEGELAAPGEVTPGTQLAYDFDNGLEANDAFKFFFDITNFLPRGPELEVSAARGDSGGPTFVNGKIAGVTSYGFGFNEAPDILPGTNSSFGEISVDTRVAFYEEFINSVISNVTPELPDLTITKTDSPDPVAKGGTLTYTLTVSNAANGFDAAGIEVKDILPPDLTVTGITVGGGGFVAPSLPLASNEITFTNGTLASGASATITITGTVPDTGEFPRTIENTAIVDPDNAIEEANENNNSVTITTQVNSDLPDLTIVKADTPDPMLVGGTLTYTLTVTNVSGGVATTNIEVKDTLPSELEFISTGVGGGGFTASQSGNVVTFAGGSLADGESAILTITGRVPQEPCILTNMVVVDPNNQITERNEDNNMATATTTVVVAPTIPPTPPFPNIPGIPGLPNFPEFPGFPPPFVPPALTPTIEPPLSNPLPPIYLSTTTSNNFRGTERPETIYGGPFDDTIDGAGGNDTILGRDGRDLLIGGNGSDKLFGNQGDDRLYGGDGDDTIYGGKDNDFINGERGHDFLRGDLGNDTVRGGDGDDTIYGGKGNDWLLGDKGDDYLSGDLGDDTLDGIGRDRDSVGEIDTLIGGEGSNLFVLGTTHTIYYDDRSPGAGYGDYALIEDFNATSDRLQLKGGVNYLLNFSPNGLPGGTGIYVDDGPNVGVWDEEDELIAVLKDIAPNDSLFSRMNFV
ncbi:trypsin-like serine protease [Trichothermofontia sichuanensis B231]|uniref:CARDB domain-containing protein n=1 Tax=Trichothermofontia sichuanensis TaxID=3045816 RepID=UPI00224577C1|nr:CARDB domain-containing protein [Trichothermofontia sichuanensis]UZQ56056.1 trypsin-like serine protease [Trichothermofontia sichuanensis B231]